MEILRSERTMRGMSVPATLPAGGQLLDAAADELDESFFESLDDDESALELDDGPELEEDLPRLSVL